MGKRKVVFNCFALLLIVCILSGCWDREELEDKAYVIGLGLDRSKEEGKVKITMLIANPEVGSMQGGGGSEEEPKEIITFDANDFLTARGTANAIISRSISYDLLKIIILSEEFAKEPIALNFLYDTLKDREIRLDSYLAVSKEKAHKYFLKNKPRMETRPHKYFQFMIDHGTYNGLIPDSTLFRFFKAIEGGNDLFLAMYTTTEKDENPKVQAEAEFKAGELNVTGDLDDTQFIGSAVFKEGKMIGTLPGQETRIINTLDESTDISNIIISTPDFFSESKESMAFRLIKTDQNKVKIDFSGPAPKIDITVPLSVEVLRNPSMADLKNEKNRQKLKQEVAHLLKTRMDEIFKIAQTELKGAPYPLSLYARKYFATVQDFKDYRWQEKFPEADINVKTEINIVDYGKLTSKPKKMEG